MVFTKTCDRCANDFESTQRHTRWCPQCRPEVKREWERRRKRSRARPPLFSGGGAIVRLADVPMKVRLRALHQLLENGDLTEDEIPLALAAALEPGDLSTRVAA